MVHKLKVRSGALFTIGNVDQSILPLYSRWEKEGRVKQGTSTFIESLIHLCNQDTENTTDMQRLCDHLNRSRGYILYICKPLVTAKLVQKDLAQGKRLKNGRLIKSRSVTRYVLSDSTQAPPLALSGSAQTPVRSIIPQNFSMVADDDTSSLAASFLLKEKPTVVKGEYFSLFVVAAALPSAKIGPLLKNSYNCTIRIGPEKFTLRVRPTTGSRVASVLDLRILAALTTLIIRRLEESKTIDNNAIVFDMDEICSLLKSAASTKSKDGGSRKRYIYEAIERWESTGFEIIDASPGFIDKYGNSLVFDTKFRFITQLDVVSTVGPTGKTPKLLKISFPGFFIDRINQSDFRYLRTLNKYWMTEKNPFAARFYLWCRRAIGHSHSLSPKPASWLHQEIEPMRSYSDFCIDMKNLFDRRYDKNCGCAQIFGYNLVVKKTTSKQSREKWEYVIWADPNDPLIGINSHYAHTRTQLEKDLPQQ